MLADLPCGFLSLELVKKETKKSKTKSHERINTPLGIQLFGIIINSVAHSG